MPPPAVRPSRCGWSPPWGYWVRWGSWPALVAAPGPVWLVLALVVGGAGLAPLLAVAFVMVGTLSPVENITEAFAWLITLITAGVALGSLLAGYALAAGLAAGAATGAAGATVAALVIGGSQRLWRELPERIE